MWLVSLQLFWSQQWTNDQQIARGGVFFSLFDLATACTSSHHFQTSSHTLKWLFHRACPQWLCCCTMAPPGISWLVIMWFVDCSGAQRGHLEHSGSAWISSICWPFVGHLLAIPSDSGWYMIEAGQSATVQQQFPKTPGNDLQGCRRFSLHWDPGRTQLWPSVAICGKNAASFSRCPCDRRQLQWGTQSRPWISAAKDDGSSSLWEL